MYGRIRSHYVTFNIIQNMDIKTSNEINSFNPTFSVMKGIAIISVVIGHTINDDRFVNQYHLATFFFVSGYFLKYFHINNLRYFIWNKFKHLYIPYMKFGVLFLLIHNILYYLHIANNRYNWNDIIHEIRNFTIGLTSQEPLMGAMWFLPALFVVSVIAASTISISKKYTNTNILIIAIPVIGYILCKLEIKSPRCLWEYMQICSIYFIGFYYKNMRTILK